MTLFPDLEPQPAQQEPELSTPPDWDKYRQVMCARPVSDDQWAKHQKRVARIMERAERPDRDA